MSLNKVKQPLLVHYETKLSQIVIQMASKNDKYWRTEEESMINFVISIFIEKVYYFFRFICPCSSKIVRNELFICFHLSGPKWIPPYHLYMNLYYFRFVEYMSISYTDTTVIQQMLHCNKWFNPWNNDSKITSTSKID